MFFSFIIGVALKRLYPQVFSVFSFLDIFLAVPSCSGHATDIRVLSFKDWNFEIQVNAYA